MKRVSEPAERPKTKFQIGLKKRPLPPGNESEPASKGVEANDEATSSDSDSSNEANSSGAALENLLGGYGDSSSSESSSDDDDNSNSGRRAGNGSGGPAKKAKVAPAEASKPAAALAAAFKPTAFVPASKSNNTLAMEAMRAKMSGDRKKYAELMEQINRGEGATE